MRFERAACIDRYDLGYANSVVGYASCNDMSFGVTTLACRFGTFLATDCDFFGRARNGGIGSLRYRLLRRIGSVLTPVVLVDLREVEDTVFGRQRELGT